MIEVVLAIAVVGVMAAAAMSVAGAAARERLVAGSRAQAGALAHALLEEIMTQPIETEIAGATATVGGGGASLFVGGASASLGTTGGSLPVSRAAFDEVQDYDGWTSTPPMMRSGGWVPGADGLTRSVTVTEVAAGAPAGGSVADTGVFRVEVRVLRGTAVLATATAVRSKAADEVME